MTQDAVTYLKEIVDPIKLLKHYDAKNITEHSDDIRCSCPIHKGNNPTAFIFKKDNKLWYCHTKCNTGGDIYDLVMHMENIDFVEAVQRIAEIFNINISDMTIKLRTDKALQDTKKWIETMRGIMESKVKTAPEPFDINILGRLCAIKSYRQFNKETLKHFGIKFCLNNQRIIIPIYNNKKLIGVTMRRTKPHPAKWIHQPVGLQTRNLLFNYDNIELNKPIILCEGVWDVLNYWQNGYKNTVASFGCHLTHEQEYMLLRATHEIILSYDNDNAGIIGTYAALTMLQNKSNIKIAKLPENCDPGAMNNEQMQHAINNAYKAYEWRAKYEKSKMY